MQFEITLDPPLMTEKPRIRPGQGWTTLLGLALLLEA